jgi:hypothetical protein
MIDIPGLRGCMAAVALGALASVASAGMPEWRTVTPDELAMTSEPNAPGAPAVILYMEVERNEDDRREYRYQQIKILTEDGRRAADLQITFDKDRESVSDIEARTIRKDGTIVPYTGEIFEKPLAKSTDQKVLAKTLALTDATVGSIVEYRYARRAKSGLYNTRWLLANSLFTREAHYAYKSAAAMRYGTPRGLPPGTPPLVVDKKTRHIRLQTKNVPAFVEEEYAPPEAELQYRLDFIHAWDWDRPATDPEKFWKRYVEEQREVNWPFHRISSSLRPVVKELAPESDPPELRLRKLYERCAALRNKSYEPERSDDEVARADEYVPSTVREVWKLQYGWGRQIDLLFMAMAREAGFEVAEVWVADRGDTFFDPRQMDPGPLDWLVIGVMLNGKEQYFSPGSRFMPFGMLGWGKTGVKGLRIDSKQHAWIDMPVARVDDARIRHMARMKLGSDGVLQGRVTMTATGREALWRRYRENNEDATHRRKFLEDDLLEALGSEAIVKVRAEPDWEGAGDFVVEYDLTVPERVVSAGNSRLLSAGWFAANSSGAFRRPERVNPMYFRYPWDSEEDVQIELPEGWALAAVPEPTAVDYKLLVYSMDVSAAGNTVRMKRHFRLNLLLLPGDAYAAVRKFYEDVRAGDEQQIVLKTPSH